MKSMPPSLGRWATVILLVLASAYLLYYQIAPAVRQILVTLVPWVLPFAVALFLAALLDPLVSWLERSVRLPRTLASLTAVLGLVLTMAVLMSVVLVQLAAELTRLTAELPHYGGMLKEGLTRLVTLCRSWQLPPQMMTTVGASIERITGYAGVVLSNLAQGLVQVIGAIPGFFISAIVTLVATFFFSRDKLAIRRGLFSLFPWLNRPSLKKMREDLGAGLVGYIKAQGFLVSLTALQVLVGLLLLRVRYAFSLSILIALLDILPVVGPGVVFLPWAAWEFLNGRFAFGLALAILYATITIIRQLLEPRVVGRSLGLHPLAALVSIYVGLQALGLVGAVLSPLVLVLLKAAYQAGLFGSFPPRGRNG